MTCKCYSEINLLIKRILELKGLLKIQFIHYKSLFGKNDK